MVSDLSSDEEYGTLDRDTVTQMYPKAREDVLADPGYMLDIITAMQRQREYRQISEDL